MNGTAPASETKSEYYPPYAEYSKTLRTWFVAYGIGGPVVLLANEKVWPSIVSSGLSFDIGLLFLIGGGVQVISALLNKHAMWHLYYSEAGPYDTAEDKRAKELYKGTMYYKVAEWYSIQNWIDELLDVYTLVLFGWATWLVFRILSPPTGKVVIRDHDGSYWAWTVGIAAGIVLLILFGILALRRRSEPPPQPGLGATHPPDEERRS